MTTTETTQAPPPLATCSSCGKTQADGLDGWCTPCRSISACHGLCQDLTDALENFLDARWAPHEAGMRRPAYYLDEPDFGDRWAEHMAEIIEAHAQIGAVADRLVRLAMGPAWLARVESYEPHHYGTNMFDGFHASFDFGYRVYSGRVAGAADPRISPRGRRCRR